MAAYFSQAETDLKVSYVPAVASLVVMVVKVVFSWMPRPFTTAMIATEMPAAMRPYSMAVAPDSSAMNWRNFAIMKGSIRIEYEDFLKMTCDKKEAPARAMAVRGGRKNRAAPGAGGPMD